MTQGQLARYGLVGSGPRAEAFVRAALRVPDRFALAGVVTRTADRGREVEAAWKVPSFRSVAELVAAEHPDFVIVSVPWAVTPVAIQEVVALGVPVLAETPPAPDVPGLVALWSAVGASGLVQVAEQYLLIPEYAAVLALLRSGALGEITFVSILSRGLYHSVSMLRHMLDVGDAPAVVAAASLMAPLTVPDADVTKPPSVVQSESVTAILDFETGRRGVYDFNTNQWSSPVRTPRIVVRGSSGELVDDTVIRFTGPGSVVSTAMLERETVGGLDGAVLELATISLDGQVLYRNPYVGKGLSHDDLSAASIVERMGAWCRDEGPAPYPLAEANQDHLINLTIAESARTGRPVVTEVGPWSR